MRWVEPRDWRESEVRLLHEEGTFGENPDDNLLIEGDALYVLTSLSSIPEFAQRHKGKITLCCIDPPFNTGSAFARYRTALRSACGARFRDRLIQIHGLLSSDGIVCVHLESIRFPMLSDGRTGARGARQPWHSPRLLGFAVSRRTSPPAKNRGRPR